MNNKTNKQNKVRRKFGKSFKVSLMILALTVIVTYTYFNNPTVFTFSEQKSLPIYRVNTEEKKVAITFDVNWGTDRTEEILKILEKHDAKATFFLIGKWIDYNNQNVELVKKMHEQGHELGNHSNIHPDFTSITRDRIIKELEITDSKIYEITNTRNKLFRFPKGEYDQNSIKIVKELGYTPIQWDVDSIDWKEQGLDVEYNRVANKIKPGSIILFHNNTAYTPENLDRILTEFTKQGYKFVTVSELIYHDNYEIDITGEQKRTKTNTTKI